MNVFDYIKQEEKHMEDRASTSDKFQRVEHERPYRKMYECS